MALARSRMENCTVPACTDGKTWRPASTVLAARALPSAALTVNTSISSVPPAPDGEIEIAPRTALPRCLDGITTALAALPASGDPRPEEPVPVVDVVVGEVGGDGGVVPVGVGVDPVGVLVVEGGVVVLVVPPGPRTTIVAVMNECRSLRKV
jgi:hypothetical protein